MHPRPLPGRFLVISASIAACMACRAHAVVVGQPDTFSDGTVQSWFGGDTAAIAAGGPGGIGDLFLNVATNSGGGPGSHLATHNSDTRWTGDYITAGITSIQADMQNVGATTLQMRLVLFGNGNRWTSTSAITLAPGGGWQHLTFPIGPGSLTEVAGSGSYASSIAAVNQIMFRHDGSAPSSGGELINGKIGIDNVVAIPGPGGLGLLGASGLLAMRRRR